MSTTGVSWASPLCADQVPVGLQRVTTIDRELREGGEGTGMQPRRPHAAKEIQRCHARGNLPGVSRSSIYGIRA